MSIDYRDDEALLARFRDWLQATRADAEATNGYPGQSPTDHGPEADVGLYRLVEEFTAFRHEVKLETKGARNLHEQIEAILPVLRQAIDHFRSVGSREEQMIQAVARPMAEALADLDESLERGRLEIEKARDRLAASAASLQADFESLFRRQRWYRRWFHSAYHGVVREFLTHRSGEGQPEIFAALLEGYGFIQSRLRGAMQAAQVSRIECVGRPVDPSQMTVLVAIETTDQPPGYVVDEIRRGYTWRGRVLRYAEVRAARGRVSPPAELVEDEVQDETETEIENEASEALDQGAD